MSTTQTPVVFGHGPLHHGMLTTPRKGEVHGRGVVVCQPLGYQNLCAHRPLRTLAQQLARAGWPVLRFDWLGTGDSDDADPRRIPKGAARWIDSIREAAAELRSLTGVAEVVLAGAGVGGTLAASAASEARASGLVLLSPSESGKAYLRELRAFERIAAREPSERVPDPSPGGIEASGFFITDADAEAIASLNLLRIDPAALGVRHALLGTTHGDRAASALVDWLAGASIEVQHAVVPELGAMWDEPQFGALPHPCSALVLDWLSSLPKGRRIDAQRPASAPVMTLRTGLREETIKLEGACGALVGVTCGPGDTSREDPWLVFLNAGGVRRSGPARLWTTLARTWAPSGLRSLRLDLSGIGDSDGDLERDEHPTNENRRLYIGDYGEDVRTGLRWTAEHAGEARVGLLGLCSGAYWSFQTALSTPGIALLVLINPAILFWDDQILALQAFRRARGLIRSPRRWHRLVDRRLLVEGRDALRGATLVARQRGEVSGHGHAIRAGLERLSNARVATLMVYSAGDPGLLYLENHLGADYRSVLERYGVTLEIVAGADHTFRPLATHAPLQSAIERRLVRVGFLPSSLPPAAERRSVLVGPGSG